MIFENDHLNVKLRDQLKGIKQILTERGS